MSARFDLQRLRQWIPAILWTVQIFYFSTLPRGSYPKIDQQQFATSYLQYLYHFGQYFCLAVLVYRAAQGGSVCAKTRDRTSQILDSRLLLIAVIAFMDELIQIPVPTRTFSVRDLVADLVGGGFGMLILQFGKRSTDPNQGRGGELS